LTSTEKEDTVKIFTPIANVEFSGNEGFILLADGYGEYLVQNVETKLVSLTSDVYDVSQYFLSLVKDHGLAYPGPDEEETPIEVQPESVVLDVEETGDIWTTKAAESQATEPGFALSYIPPNSSVIKYIEYFTDDTLHVRMGNGEVAYKYFDVPSSVVDDFCDADSAGKFFNENIKGRYDSIRIT
jgi:hypothetical protein